MTEEIINKKELKNLRFLLQSGQKLAISTKEFERVFDKIERLEQENKELKKQIESDKGLITVGGKQQYEYLQKIDNLEQENKELKKENETLNYQWHKRTEIGDEWYKVAENYRSALDTIQRMVLSAWEQGKYLDGGLYDDLTNEFAKINEVLNEQI